MLALIELALAGQFLTTRVKEEDIRRWHEAEKRLYIQRATRPYKPLSYTSNAANELDIPEELWKSKNTGLEALLSDMGGLLQQDSNYNDDFMKPTEYAFTTTWNLLDQASSIVEGLFPLGTVYPDGDGGLRVEWIRPQRELRLIIPSCEEERHYIYHESGAEYAADYNVSAKSLGNWLNWLNQDERTAKWSSYEVGGLTLQLYSLSSSSQQPL